MESNKFRENCLQSRQIEIFIKYLKRILIPDKFSFQRCIISLCHFNRSQMNGDGGGGAAHG